MNKILERVIALILVILLTSANVFMLGEYTIAYALSDEELNKQNSSTNNKNVEFNSYFEEEVHNKTFEINSENAKFYLKIAVNNVGYLESGTIEFQNSNFKFKEGISNDYIQSIDIENNKVELNKINNGTDITIEIPIEILKSETISLDYFNKEIITKFTGTYIDGTGSEKSIEKEVTNKLSWKGTAETELNVEANKYIPYSTNGNYGIMLQTAVNSKIKDSSLPIKCTNIEVTVPTINNVKPTSVNVIAKNTLATNGKSDGVEFNNSNYSYNRENGKVIINVTNLNDSISWTKDRSDEYLITYLFEGQEIYEYASKNQIKSEITTNANITVYNNEENTISGSVTTPITFTEKVGTIADFEIIAPEQISKGFIYASYDTDKKEETNYYTKYIVTVNSTKLTGKIEFVQEYDKFLTKDGNEGSTTVAGNNYAYNKKIEISQIEFNKILGEDGTITVKNESGEILGIINKESTLENGIYSLDISSKNNNKLFITTSTPITEGQLGINIVKALKGNIDYSKEQMKNFEKVKVELEGKTNTTTFTTWQEALLKEPVTKVGLEINKKDLTTVVKNENVEIRVILDTSNEYNALFENPTLKITLPSYIKNIDLKSTNILLDSGLKIKSTQIKEENENKVIYVMVEGKQTEYLINAEYKGAIIVLNTDITLDELAPSGLNKIKLEYINTNDVATNEKETIEQEINYVAPNGVVAANGISNYKDNMPKVESISGETKMVEIDTYAKKRITTISATVLNNYSNDISNIVILGRIPAEGSKKIDTNEDTNSTFMMPLSTGISISDIEASNYTVYYSDKANATKDLQDANNGWSTTATTSSKSYLIVFNDNYKINTGNKLNFSYNAEIPANLETNQSTYAMYKVYYDNNSEIGTMPESKVSSIIGIKTEAGPELEVNLSSTANVVREGQVIRMDAQIKNIGDVDVEGVKLTSQKPEYISFARYGLGNGFYVLNDKEYSVDVGNIKTGETKTVSYYIKIDNDILIDETYSETGEAINEGVDDFPKTSTNSILVTSEQFKEGIKAECNLQIEDAKIAINTFTYTAEDDIVLDNDIIRYCINLTNISGLETNNNVTVKVKLPQGLSYERATIKENFTNEEETEEGISYDNSTNEITINIASIEITKFIEIYTKAEDITGSFSIMPVAILDGVEHYSNILENKAEKVKLNISKLTSSPRYVKESENIEYKLSITNEGEAYVRIVEVIDELPEELEFIEAKYIYAGKEYSRTTLNEGKVKLTINVLEPGQKIDITILAKAKLLANKDDKEVQNTVTVSAQAFDTTETNTVTNIIEYYPDIHDNANTGGSSSNRYRITGTSWIDVNKDGERNSEEDRISDMQVILLSKDGKSIVTDANTKENKITKTSSNGTYQFDNIPNGEYLVVFLYDSSNYSLTEYKKATVDQSLNSDVIDINITLNGERRIAAITDIITVNGENVRDIDIGVYSASKFDLKLDKYISKITLKTPTIGTRVDHYDNSDIAKVEVLGQNLGKSTAVIEYKIIVTNEGSVPGYVKKIVDYLPEELSFNTELNPDWYLSDNGNIYNSSIENEIIRPGETKEVTLVVSLSITEDKLGSMYNEAEIYESYNEQGLKDVDSIEANRVDSEDDMGQSILVVSLVTGKIIMYTSIAIVVMALLGFGVFKIKKHVLNNKKTK